MKDIIQSLSESEKNCPHHIAVQHNHEQLTYKELNQYSNILARMIQETDRPIIAYGHMSPFMIVAMIASIKAGCGYVPLDTSLPQDRLHTIIKKMNPQFLINTTDENIEQFELNVIDINTIKNNTCELTFESKIKADDIAYTIFTSGSTGEPKGVQISYKSLNDFTRWMVDLNQLGEYQQWLNQAPFSFDLSVMAIYPCLATSGTLNLVDKMMINKPKRLSEMLDEAKINVWVSTPSFMEMCLMLPQLTETKYASLKEFFFCGEIFAHRTAKMLLQRFPSAWIYNTYGPTEATVAVTSILITEDILREYNPLPVGAPRPGTSLILGHNDELIITGDCVSMGYVYDEIKTNKVFKKANNQRAYHTGDKAEQRDKQWFINGRIDFQIKLNGYRMELEEIEFQLRQIDCVKEAVVVPIYKDNKVTQIHAVVVSNRPSHIDLTEQEMTRDIKGALKEHIPEYMIPKKIHFTDKLPLTVNGKLDRKKIAEGVN